jgi:peptidoglycan/LPS O-acetylase OafA/YrhL
MNWIDLQTGLRDKTSYLSELESFRGWAISLVVCYHFFGLIFDSNGAEHSIWLSFISSGGSGVTLFFVLSAFLLSRPFLDWNQQHDIHVSRFYLSRVLRILPLYSLVVVFSIVVTGEISLGLKALLFQYVGFELFPFGVVWWTLSTEVQFYLLLPPLMWLLSFRSGRGLLLLLLIIWAYFYYQLVLKQAIAMDTQYTTILTSSLFVRLPTFLIGIGLALIYRKINLKPASSIRRHPIWRCASSLAVVTTIVVLGLVLQHSSALGSFRSELIWPMKHTYEALCWALLILLVICCQPYGKVLFVNPIMGTLGKLSYSIYLFHLPIQFYLIFPLVGPPSPDNILTWDILLRCLLSLVLIILASLLSYTLIEKPFLKLKSRIPLARADDKRTRRKPRSSRPH